MSVWSRSHSDLAQLARTLQTNNRRTRRRLSTSSTRTRSLSPITQSSEDTHQPQVGKTASVHDVSLDQASCDGERPAMNGDTVNGALHAELSAAGYNVNEIPFNELTDLNANSVDGNDSCYSDVFLQSSASESGDAFQSLTSTPDATHSQHRDMSCLSKVDNAPSFDTKESECPRVPQIFIFNDNDSPEAKSPESDSSGQSNIVSQSIDSGIGMESVPEKSSSEPSENVMSDTLTASNSQLNESHSPQRDHSHLCAIADPNSPRLSARSPDLLKKLREVSSSISANKVNPVKNTNRNERPSSLERNFFSSARKNQSGFVKDKSSLSSKTGISLLKENQMLLMRKKADPADDSVKNECSVLETERQEKNSGFLEIVQHSSSKNDTLSSEATDSFSLKRDEVSHEQYEHVISDNLTDTDNGYVISGEEVSPADDGVSSSMKNLVDGTESSDVRIISLYHDSSIKSVSSVSQNSSVTESVLSQVQSATGDSTTSATESKPLDVSNVTVTTVSVTTSSPLSVSFSEQHQSCQDSVTDNNDTSVSASSSDSSLLTVHDLDLNLIPLSAIGIMVGLNGARYQVSEKLSSSVTLHTSPKSTTVTDSVPGSALKSQRTVAVSHSSESQVTEVIQANGVTVPDQSHITDNLLSQRTSVATHCSDTIVHSNSNTTTSLHRDIVVVSSLCDASGPQRSDISSISTQPLQAACESHTADFKTSQSISDQTTQEISQPDGVTLDSQLYLSSSDNSCHSVDLCNQVKMEACDTDTHTVSEVDSCSTKTHSQGSHVNVQNGDSSFPNSNSPHCLDPSLDKPNTSNVLDVHDNSFTKSDIPSTPGAHCDTNHNLAEAQITEMESSQIETPFETETVPDGITVKSSEDTPKDNSLFVPAFRNFQCQADQATRETQTLNADESILYTNSSSISDSSFSAVNPPNSTNAHCQSEHTPTVRKAMKMKSDAFTVVESSSHSSPRTKDSASLYSLKTLNHNSAETQTSETDSRMTVLTGDHFDDDSSDCTSTLYQELSDLRHYIQTQQSSVSSVATADKPGRPQLGGGEDDLMHPSVPESFSCEQGEESISRQELMARLSLLESEAETCSSKDFLEEGKPRSKVKYFARGDLSRTELRADKGNNKIPHHSRLVDPLTSVMAGNESFFSEDGDSSRDILPSQILYQSHDTQQCFKQPPSNPTSINPHMKHLSGTKHLAHSSRPTGITDTSLLSDAPSSSVSGPFLHPTRKVKHHRRLESDSETEKSLVSASVQVSLSGTSDHRSRCSKSHRRRTRDRGEGSSSKKTHDFNQSQTSCSSSSVDSLLSLSDNGSGSSSYCSEVLHYLTQSSSHSQHGRPVSRRRLKKLLALLRQAEQPSAAAAGVSGLSDVNRTVADLQHLCLFLSRNLELQTQQQLLERQHQRLQEHQQQQLKEQASQGLLSFPEKKTKSPREESPSLPKEETRSPQGEEEPPSSPEKSVQSVEEQQDGQKREDTPSQKIDREEVNQQQQERQTEEHSQSSQPPQLSQPRQLLQAPQPTQEKPDPPRELPESWKHSSQVPQPLTRIFLKLRHPSQTTARRLVPERLPKTSPRSKPPNPPADLALPQKGNCKLRSLVLSTAHVHPEVLIQEACKHTELLERLGVDRDLFGTPAQEENEEENLPQPAAKDPQQADNATGESQEEREKVGEGEESGEGGSGGRVEMESPEEMVQKLDEEFDKTLVDMKPHVLKLPHKSDRQRCAVWIKKLCEPPSSGITGRKTRNMYSQLMVHMLKRGSLQDPFDRKPEDGPLPPLPSYMSIYFDEPLEKPQEDTEKLPDWVEGELGESVGSSLFRRSDNTHHLGNPTATSTWVSHRGDNSASVRGVRQRPHTSMGITLGNDPELSPIRGDHRHHTGYSADDVGVSIKSPPVRCRSPSDRERRQLPDVRANHGATDAKTREQSDMEWPRPLGVTASSTTSFAKGTMYQDDTSLAKPGNKEVALRTKMAEAKYHEEKLRLQQKHDAAVQKILDRKNSEIEDVKSHYRSKTKELEETITKLERKVQTLVKESGVVRETKDKQISELKKMVQDSTETQRNEYEKKMHDLEADFEQQKFELQKLHTRNIQEILDDTNARLQRMDAEYNQQATSTTAVIKDLESRVQQLMGEVDRTLQQRSTLEKDKAELLTSVDRLTSDLEEQKHRNHHLEREHQKKLESSEHEMRTLRNKTEASLEFLKQEHSIAAAKAADSITELEQQVEYLKKALKDAEEQRQRQMRETEQVHHQDKLHLENLHDKQVRSMKKELEQLEQEMQRKLSRLEQLLQDKEVEVQKQKELGREQSAQADKALEEFKLQVEKNQQTIYSDMKQQMDQLEGDLKKSKQSREKQSREFSRQMEEASYKHEHELTELKMTHDNEKAQLLHEVHLQKEHAATEHDRDTESLREAHRNETRAIETRFKERQDKDSKIISDLENQVTELREELVQSNQLRKQQLVELGLLREEEKQKMMRDHEAEMGRLRGESEQQKLELQKIHSAETEKLLEKTNDRLKSIEREYIERGKKSSETITELQNSIKLLRDDIKRAKETAEDRVCDVRSQSEEEKLSLKKQYASNLTMVQHELETQRSRCHTLDRQIQRMEQDHEEKMTRLKLDHEDRLRGLLPGEMKQELEDTISSLKSQVSTLQQRSAMLQEELDIRLKSPLGTFTSASPIKSSV